jgi:DNA invertase Pin-like site-specific DNA recombinase
VYSYVRFSHPHQARGGGLQRQVELTAAWCARKGLQLDDGLTLHDLGVSAFRGDNVRDGALAAFLEACRTGRVPRGSYLVVESLDRLSRDEIRPALQLFLALQDFGITIVTLQPEREYSPDGSDALALIEPLIVFARAHEESVMKSHRRGEAWKRRKAEARATRAPVCKTCPAWLEPDGGGGYRVIEDRAATVRRIFDWCADGLGIYRIVARLVEEKIPAFGNSGRWNTTYVALILRLPSAMGTFQPQKVEGKRLVPDGEPIPHYFPAVVSQDLWLKARDAVTGRSEQGSGGRVSHEVNLFTRMVFCAETKDPMVIMHCQGKQRRDGAPRKNYVYLGGNGIRHATGKARRRRIDYASFEAGVLKHLSELKPADLDPPGKKRAAGGAEAEIALLAGRLVDIDSRLSRATAKAREANDFDLYLDLIAELQRDRRQTMERVASLEHQRSGEAIDLGETQSLIAILAKAKGPDREELRRRLRARINGLVREVWVLVRGEGKSPRYAHVQLFMRHGGVRSFTVFHPAPVPGIDPLPKGIDLRTYADLQ